MKKILEYSAYLLIFLLPWQTVWIIQEKMIGRGGTPLAGAWQYGAIRLYAIEVLIIFLMLLVGILIVRCVFIRNIFTSLKGWYRSRTFFLDMSIGLFVAVSLGSILWSDDRAVATMAAFHIVEGAFLFFLFRLLRLNGGVMAGAFLSAVVIQGGLGIIQFSMQDIGASTFFGIAAHDPSTLGTSVVQAGDRRWLRAYGAFPHPNVLGAYLAVGILVCIKVLSRAKQKWLWVILLFASQIILAALLFTFSRSAWIALIFAGCVCFFTRHPDPPIGVGGKLQEGSRGNRGPLSRFLGKGSGNDALRINPLVVLAIISIMTTSIFTAYFYDEIRGRVGIELSRLERQSIDERVSSLSRAAPLLKSIWYRGTGIGNFTNTLFRFEKEHDSDKASHTYQPLHNVFFMIFAELGILGIVFMCLIVFFFSRSLPVTSYQLPVTFFVLSLFDHFLWTLPFGIFFAAICFGWTSRRQDPSCPVSDGECCSVSSLSRT